MADNSTSFMCFGCHDLVHDERTFAYIRWACANDLFERGCAPQINDECYCVLDSPESAFVDPETDEACWFDPLIPESKEFLGVFVTRVGGMSDSSFQRDVFDAAGNGTIIGRGVWRGKSFPVEAYLIATSCAGMEYGFQYVKRALENPTCTDPLCNSIGACGTHEMTMRVTCPEGTVVGDAEYDFDEYGSAIYAGPEFFDDGLRNYRSVTVVDPLTKDDLQSDRCCCYMQRVSFTLQTNSALAFNRELTILDADSSTMHIHKFDWDDCFRTCGCMDKVGSRCCGDHQNHCGNDPTCGAVTAVLPELTTTIKDCFCEPLEKASQCVTDTDLPDHIDTTYRVEIFSGFDNGNPLIMDKGIRNLRVRFYKYFEGVGDPSTNPDYWKDVSPCAEARIPYMPASSTLVIDGRTNKTSLLCNGECRDASNLVFGARGKLSPFPIMANCRGMIVCVEWDTFHSVFPATVIDGEPGHVKIQKYSVWR